MPTGIPPRTGLWTTYASLLRWTTAQIGVMLPLFIVVQTLLAAGIIVGFGLLVPGLDTPSARFLSTGAPTVLLMVIGLVMVPQGVAQARTSGTFTYMRALPVPRPLLLSDLTVWLVIALLGIPVAAVVAQLRYRFGYTIDWPLLVAASVLTAVMATAVGYAIAVLLPPLPAQPTTQVLVFFVMLFSPITFPASRLPEWFQAVHDVLPFRPAADLLRVRLLSSGYTVSWRDLAVLLAWCALGLAISVRALVRRA
ncbi:ABC-2 type transport system permease protein [Thermocatellispora tengchongensis]|uniref:ABC-2 type transport system permease protein n=1 Tax=Thermocatellispora tengchongensis TaxID=1073253 RepID=A0A840P9R9_9ACTN|nr:ABC transporter permease [Thermocatellispora tengchongensis]MBB5134170.1 ABC-2 type transport system permease protein [Thermocatellispora tengchongensis]